MKTFKDLDDRDLSLTTKERKGLNFTNGYGISVIKRLSNTNNLWECAVLKDNEICYSTHITNDVIGYCTEEKVTQIMKQIQNL